MVYDLQEFKNSLNNLELSPTAKRLWVKQFNKNPELTCNNYFRKMDLLYSGMRFWEIAKGIILKHRQEEEIAVPEEIAVNAEGVIAANAAPEVIDFQYFYRLNNYRWGDTMIDVEEYEEEHGVIL